MGDSEKITFCFTVDKKIYDTYESVVIKNGENVNSNLIKYMLNVIKFETPNADTIEAIEEVNKLKTDPNKRVYNCFEEIQRELDDE